MRKKESRKKGKKEKGEQKGKAKKREREMKSSHGRACHSPLPLAVIAHVLLFPCGLFT